MASSNLKPLKSQGNNVSPPPAPPTLHDNQSKALEAGSILSVPHQNQEDNQKLEKNFSLVSLASIGLVVGNEWPALGGSLLTSIANGGAPGVIYEFIAVSLCYFTVAAVLAELASALPSSSGVHLWASIPSGRRCGRVVGYLAGYWNCLAWVFAEASISCIAGNICVEMYAQMHPGFVAQRWHVFVCYLLVTWLACAVVCFGNSIVPRLNVAGLALILLGALTTIIVCAAMLSKGTGPASTETVWATWSADIGYPDGFVFIAGMLNGAFAMGTPDATIHLAEEIPRPEIKVPKAIAAQYCLGFVTALAYLIAILYSITDYDVLYTSSFPIAEVYSMATKGSRAGTILLLLLLLLPTLVCTIGLYVTVGRTLWTLARVDATPFSNHLGHISERHRMPFAATVTSGGLVTVLGIIYLGSSTAFNSFIASFILHSSASYIAALLPYLFRRGNPGFPRGPFYMRGALGWLVHGWACAHMMELAVAENFATAAAYIRSAASKGAHLAVLPEFHLTSWAPGAAGFVDASKDSMTYLAKYQDLAKELNINIVPGTFGAAHTVGEVEELHNMAYFIAAGTGEIMGSYQKKNLWHPERPYLTSSGPTPHKAFDTPLKHADGSTVRAGLLICWDLAFPEAFRALIADGADIIIIPSYWFMTDVDEVGLALNPNSERDFLNSATTLRAFENTAAVIFCNAGGLSCVAMPIQGALGRLDIGTEEMAIVPLDVDVLRIAEDNYKIRQDIRGEKWHYGYDLNAKLS
ncbi:hypothetical protein G7046_g817 [Stylonectria norvegica]|nr:hypothetical protein G7046_g817 [Stylonectria norvegica]